MLGTFALAMIFGAVLLGARGVLCWAGELRWSVAVALATAALIAGPVLITPHTHNLESSAALTGLFGIIIFGLTRRHAAIIPDRWGSLSSSMSWGSKVAALGLLGLVAWAALGGFFWDEYSGHFGLTSVVARGIVPAQHPLFPGAPFRYHYGFDVLAAEVRAFTGANVGVSIDAAAIFCFALLLALAARAGEALGGRRAAAPAMLLVPLGSGTLQFLLFADMGTLTVRSSALPEKWTQTMPPPVISNFFQHPQGLGMPLALAALLLLTAEAEPRERRRRFAIGSFLLGALGLSQIVFFGVLGLALGTASLVRAMRRRDIFGLGFEALALLFALAFARTLGGFFAPGPAPSEIFDLRPFMPGSLALRLTWHVVVLGLPFVAFPWFVARLRAEPTALRVALVTASAVGLIVPNIISYRASWDIVKFYGIFSFFSNLLFAELVARGREAGGQRREWAHAAAALAVFSALVFLLRMSVFDGRWGVPRMHFPGPSELGRLTAEKLELFAAPSDYVFSTNIDMALGGGLLTPGFDRREVGHGFMLDEPRIDAWAEAKRRARKDLGEADLRHLGVRFLVLSPGDVETLSPEGRAALADSRRFEPLFEMEHQGHRRSVYRVLSGAQTQR